MERIQITNEPVDLWNLTEPMPNFPDNYEIWQTTLRSVYETLGEEYEGSIVGYVEPEENKDYNIEYASGHYFLKAYTPKGEILQNKFFGDKFVKWCGLRRLPFVGYVTKDKRVSDARPEGTIWIIIPKSKEQLLSAVATFYKRRKKKDKAPNIVDLSDYMSKPTTIGDITDESSFIPMRLRPIEGKERNTCTKKRLEEYRTTAPEITDSFLAEAINEKYKDFFIDNEAVAQEGVKEAYRENLPLTKENVLQQIEFLIEDRKILKYITALQYIYSPEAKRIRDKADKVVETIYETACKRVCNLSEFADEEVMDYFLNTLYKDRKDMTLSKKLNNQCCSYHCAKYDLISCTDANNFPPFRCFDYRYGKDVTFAPTFDEAKAYNDAQRSKTQQSKATETKVEQPTGGSGKGCLLWLILLPSSILGILISFL